nr:MAG TPA: hypothetical protein [Bacteriophage sp.]
MRVTTSAQLIELVNKNSWRFTSERPSVFGLMRDFTGDDGSVISMIEGRTIRSAIVTEGPTSCPLEEIMLNEELYPAILQSLMDSSKCTVKGTKFVCRTTRFKTPGKTTLLSTEIKVANKLYLAESFVFETEVKGTWSWRHRTIGVGLYHDWGQPHHGSFEDARHSHDGYLNAMKTIIGMANK